MDEDDIAQEVRIASWMALPKYDEERGALMTFLYTNAKNRLISMRRQFIRKNCPASDEKLKLVYANGLTTKIVNSLVDEREWEETEAKELVHLINQHLPMCRREDYIKMVNGEKVLKYRRDRVIDDITQITEDYI